LDLGSDAKISVLDLHEVIARAQIHRSGQRPRAARPVQNHRIAIDIQAHRVIDCDREIVSPRKWKIHGALPVN
jgi:hypothetical protein